MGKILVLYKSKYGATKKYADMLKDELSCDILAVNDYRKAVLDEYDWVHFCRRNIRQRNIGNEYSAKNLR